MKTLHKIMPIIAVIAVLLVFSCNKANFDTGIKGKVEYGEGDCMPGIDMPDTKKYKNYKGDLYFIVKADLDKLGNGDLTPLLNSSIKPNVERGRLSVQLPADTYVVIPEEPYLARFTVIVHPGEVVNKDFTFLKCTSY